jgi:hypothetical protein
MLPTILRHNHSMIDLSMLTRIRLIQRGNCVPRETL